MPCCDNLRSSNHVERRGKISAMLASVYVLLTMMWFKNRRSKAVSNQRPGTLFCHGSTISAARKRDCPLLSCGWSRARGKHVHVGVSHILILTVLFSLICGRMLLVKSQLWITAGRRSTMSLFSRQSPSQTIGRRALASSRITFTPVRDFRGKRRSA